jgi:hypothetical protein
MRRRIDAVLSPTRRNRSLIVAIGLRCVMIVCVGNGYLYWQVILLSVLTINIAYGSMIDVY